MRRAALPHLRPSRAVLAGALLAVVAAGCATFVAGAAVLAGALVLVRPSWRVVVAGAMALFALAPLARAAFGAAAGDSLAVLVLLAAAVALVQIVRARRHDAPSAA